GPADRCLVALPHVGARTPLGVDRRRPRPGGQTGGECGAGNRGAAKDVAAAHVGALRACGLVHGSILFIPGLVSSASDQAVLASTPKYATSRWRLVHEH